MSPPAPPEDAASSAGVGVTPRARRPSRFAPRTPGATAPPPAPPAPPAPWERCLDEDGELYWHSRETGEMTREDPAGVWMRLMSPKGPYWYCTRTRVVTWDEPTEGGDGEVELAPVRTQAHERLMRGLAERGVADRLRRAVEARLEDARAAFVAGVPAEAERIFRARFPPGGGKLDQRAAFEEVQRALMEGECMERLRDSVLDELRDGRLLARIMAADIAAVRVEMVAEAAKSGAGVAGGAPVGRAEQKDEAVGVRKRASADAEATTPVAPGSGKGSAADGGRGRADEVEKKKRATAPSLGAFMSNLKKAGTPTASAARNAAAAGKATPTLKPRALVQVSQQGATPPDPAPAVANTGGKGADRNVPKMSERDVGAGRGAGEAAGGVAAKDERSVANSKELGGTAKDVEREAGPSTPRKPSRMVVEAVEGTASAADLTAAGDGRCAATVDGDGVTAKAAERESAYSIPRKARTPKSDTRVPDGAAGPAGLPRLSERGTSAFAAVESGSAKDDAASVAIIGCSAEVNGELFGDEGYVNSENPSRSSPKALQRPSVVDEDGCDVAAVREPARGEPGRPRGRQVLWTERNGVAVDGHEGDGAAAGGEAPARRGPGRPRKKQKLAAARPAGVVADDGGGASPGEVHARRRPGRRRKGVHDAGDGDVDDVQLTRRASRARSVSLPMSSDGEGDAGDEAAGLLHVRNVLEQIARMEEAESFLEPVDSNVPGCEDYYAEIKHPMDLATILTKLPLPSGRTLRGKRYVRIADVLADVNVVWENCFKYNPIGDEICQCARVCRTRFELLMEPHHASTDPGSRAADRRKSSRSTHGVPSARLRGEGDDADREKAERRALGQREKLVRKKKPQNATVRDLVVDNVVSGGSRQACYPPLPSSSLKRPVGGPPGRTGEALVGATLMVFTCDVPGLMKTEEVEPLRWYECSVYSYNGKDGTHCLRWAMNAQYSLKARVEEYQICVEPGTELVLYKVLKKM
jgi:Bromodomain